MSLVRCWAVQGFKDKKHPKAEPADKKNFQKIQKIQKDCPKGLGNDKHFRKFKPLKPPTKL